MKVDQVFGVLLILLAIWLAVRVGGSPDPGDLFAGIGDQGTTADGDGAASGAGGGDGSGSGSSGGDAAVAGRSGGSGSGSGGAEPVVTRSDLCAAVPDTSAFRDLGRAHDAAIRCMDAAGIVTGVSPRRFAPGEPVTRAQTAAYVVAAIDEANRLAAEGVTLRDVPAVDGTQFRDVSGASPHRDAIARLDQTPILQGYVDLRFEPSGSVTRGQVASIIDRTYRYLNDAALPIGRDRFRDDEKSVHEDSINAVAAAGIMPGVGDGRFAPGRSVRRGQMASYLARMLVRMQDKGRIDPVPAGGS